MLAFVGCVVLRNALPKDDRLSRPYSICDGYLYARETEKG